MRRVCPNFYLCLPFHTQQEGVLQVQLTPAMIQQLNQNTVDIQSPRPNVVHSILAQPLHITGQVPGQLQMALAQVLAGQNTSQTQTPTTLHNTQVVVSFSFV